MKPLGSAPMRKLIFAGLATLSLSIIASAAQRGAVPAMSAPAIRAVAPVAAPAHVPAVSGNHFASPRGPVSAHPGPTHVGMVPARPGTHPIAPAAKPTAPPSKITINGGSPVIPPPLNPGNPFIPGFLPSDFFSSTSCYFNCYPVPGFGFDYEHFFAVHPNWPKYQSQFTGVIVPGWGGGFYYPVPYYSEAAPQEALQENPPAQAEQPQESSARASAPSEETSSTAMGRSYAYTPTQPVEEYVFVKRDGTRIFAVAYSLSKDKLQYVTKEGLRRTLPLDALDYDATMKSNEERGNTVTLPGVPPAAMAMAM